MSSTDFGLLFARGFNAYVGHLHERLAAAGFADLRPTFGLPLRALHEAPRTLTELAGELGVSKQAASKVVKELEQRGLVDRGPSPTDGRASVLELSDRGAALVDEAIRIGADVERSLARHLGVKSADRLREALELLAYDPPWSSSPASPPHSRRVW